MQKSTSYSIIHLLASGLILLVGLIFRFKHFLDNRSLWMDEAALAHVIVCRSANEILGYVGHTAHFPPSPTGFLLLQKLSVSLYGPHEMALRLVPLIFSILSLIVFYFLLKKITTSKSIQLVCLSFMAISEPMIYFAAELRPYTLDVFVSIILLWGAINVCKSRCATIPMFVYSFVCALVVWCSFPSILVVAGLTGGIGLMIFFRREFSRLPMLILCSAIWINSYWMFYTLSRDLIHSKGYKSMVDGMIMPWTEGLLASLVWLINSMLDMLTYFYKTPVSLIFVTICILGVFRWCRRDRTIALLLILPIVACLSAAMLHLYPFWERRILFLLPMVTILLGAGIVCLAERCQRYFRVVVIVIVVVLLSFPMKTNIDHIFHPRQVEEMRPLMEYFAAHQREGDAIFMNSSSQYAFGYYRGLLGLGSESEFVVKLVALPDNNHPGEYIFKAFYDYHLYNDSGFLMGIQSNDRILKELQQMRAKLDTNSRTWLFLSKSLTSGQRNFILGKFHDWGQQVDVQTAPGVSLHLFDLSRSDDEG